MLFDKKTEINKKKWFNAIVRKNCPIKINIRKSMINIVRLGIELMRDISIVLKLSKKIRCKNSGLMEFLIIKVRL